MAEKITMFGYAIYILPRWINVLLMIVIDVSLSHQGFFTGVGKGLLGTVAKPVAGLFDFASGTTAALRETTSRVSRYHPPPVRHRRCCVDPSGALTRYSVSQARGQEYLLRLTDGELSEK